MSGKRKVGPIKKQGFEGGRRVGKSGIEKKSSSSKEQRRKHKKSKPAAAVSVGANSFQKSFERAGDIGVGCAFVVLSDLPTKGKGCVNGKFMIT